VSHGLCATSFRPGNPLPLAGNSFWNVEQIDGQSMTLRSQDGQLTRRLDLNDSADMHTDLGKGLKGGENEWQQRKVVTLRCPVQKSMCRFTPMTEPDGWLNSVKTRVTVPLMII
ncbi:hypothetical protein, partial [Enterobacter bugandensis]|uniref:hypothetical protein n=1 Tax=Enterobacter bugandensis TaxID=881260 RepID=UPI002361E000